MINNNHQPDQPVITRITSPPSPIQKTALFACFRFLIFHPYFQGGQLTPFVPMCGRPWTYYVRAECMRASSWLAAGDASPSDRLMPHVVIMAKLSELSSARTEQSRDSRAIPN